ncbi:MULTISPECIES: AraC family transcriptional regulator [unclassified Mesorhizobium]|uniref:helix-turn-helix domain-containing protein n=2 Tax=Mesorhizobium TaxID=68287 RepID=UPI000BAF83AE|nr:MULTISPECIES: AraC family transcriptional regulator [unclassified Mesorhizobium]TGT61176.1 AraC family transcriptional regulator [Mesorhizobium sp. M00.F.Ca.ET.170.01.1.1]PBB84192.1 transcriptional regulator [Mesorhizobium sp. WSM3876]RWB68170.1 MAG: AraC family transcriptional regulator [Mesorhizobium sp.]RWB84587.1 MAG: AraC family transcriptional regulator [Mesorhizobium sp.]RWE26486.1 MAG: AraC family transcriptional regulator [Mesorhizobium sp.]
MEAVLARSTGFFRERPAGGGLAGVFSAVWVHRMPQENVPPIVITPDATIDLQWIDGRFRVAGPDKEPQIERPPAGAVIVGFRFLPGAAAGWLGLPASEIVGERLDLAELWGGRARELSDGIKHAPDLAGMVRLLEETVGRQTQGCDALDPLMGRAFDVIHEGLPPEAPLLPFLVRRLNMSERTLRRRFDDAFGYGPKTLDRILRFNRFRRLREKAGDASTAVLAIEAGYADQAHLIRESRRLTGLTPSALA